MKYTFGTVNVTERSKELVKHILDSGRLSGGKHVRDFEKRFADLIGVKEAVAVSSGTDADALPLAVLYDYGASRGDEVIIPALSFVSTATAPLQAGFTPVFADIKRNTLNIDPEKIEEKITEKTRAIMPVHLMGKPADMDTINKIARKHKLTVIEDAAEAHGAKYKNRNIGSIGDMAAFSLYIAHIVTTVEGGIITTDNEDYADIMRSLRAHGRACNCKSCVVNTRDGNCAKRFIHGMDIRFIFERIGFSCKMNELEAAVGLGNLDEYQHILEKRRKNFFYLSESFKRFNPRLRTIGIEDYEELGPHAFPVMVGEDAGFTRDDLVSYLESREIDTRNLFSSIPSQIPAFRFMNYKEGDFPEAEYIGQNGIHVGVHQDLEKHHLDFFIETVDGFLKSRK